MQFALCNAVSVCVQRARVASNAQMHTVQVAINIEQYIYIYIYICSCHIQNHIIFFSILAWHSCDSLLRYQPEWPQPAQHSLQSHERQLLLISRCVRVYSCLTLWGSRFWGFSSQLSLQSFHCYLLLACSTAVCLHQPQRMWCIYQVDDHQELI